MPELDKLKLAEDEVPVIDYDAPEPGTMPPPCYPGTYELLLKMPEKREDWFDTIEVNVGDDKNPVKKAFLKVFFAAELLTDASGQPVPPLDDGSPRMLRGQGASFYKHPKMSNSEAGDLIRSLGLRLEGNFTSQSEMGRAVETLLAGADGRVRFHAEVGWEAYFKSTDTRISTNPRKKRGDLPWPRGADGLPELTATNPSTGERAYGYARIMRYKLPSAT